MEDFDDKKKNVVVAHQKANISVPIKLTPRINTRDAISYCCGDPVIKKRTCQCDYCRKLDYSFVLSQSICIEIPIEFFADAIAKGAYIDCAHSTNKKGDEK